MKRQNESKSIKIQKQYTPYNMEINKSYKELLKNQFLTEVKAIPKTKIIKKTKTKTFRTIAVVILRVRPV